MASCDVKQNTISHFRNKKLINEANTVVSSLFFIENENLSNLARTKYGVENKGQLFITKDIAGEKVKAIPNEEFFSELQEKHDSKNQLLQISGETVLSKASDETIKKITEFLKRIGVDIKKSPYININGERVDANGVANIFARLVEVVEGKENVALVEEAMHFATFIIKQTNPELYKQMLNRVDKYSVYQQVLEEYRNDSRYQTDKGTPDFAKIKFEAIGKVLAENFILSQEGSTDKPELLEQRKTWWEKIRDWFKKLFNIAGFDPFQIDIESLSGESLDEINQQVQEFAEFIADNTFSSTYAPTIRNLVDQGNYLEVINAIIDQLSDENSFDATVRGFFGGNESIARELLNFYNENLFFQLDKTIEKLDETSRKVINKPIIDESGEPSNDYFIGDVKVKNRVTKWIKNFVKGFKAIKERTLAQKARDKQFQEWGLKGHRDIEKIMSKYLTSDGKVIVSTNQQGDRYLVPQNNIHFDSEFDPNNELGLFNVLENYVKETLLSYPEGTIFRVEQTIYDPKNGKPGERDLAGTMDFLAILPDGKVDILDWKFTSINKDLYEDIAPKKQEEWNLQMTEYKKILKNEYGIKDGNFRKTRMIPFVVTYASERVDNKPKYYPINLEVSDPDVKMDTKTYLLPVPTRDEATGNKKLDEIIRSVVSLYNTLKDLPVTDKHADLKTQQLRSLFKTMRHLQVSQNLEPLAEQIEILVRETERLIDDHTNNFLTIENLSEGQISEQATKLLLKAHALQQYKDLGAQLRDFYGKTPTPEQKEIIEKLSEASKNANNLFAELREIINDFAEKYIAERRGIKDLTKAERTITGITREFTVTSKIPTAAVRTLYSMIENSGNQREFDLSEAVTELEEIKKEVDNWGGLKAALEKIKQKGKNKLVNQYKSDFYRELEQAIQAKDIDWIKENINLQEFKKYLEKRYNEQKPLIEEFFYVSDPEKNQEIRDQKLKQLELTTNPDNPEAYYEYYNVRKFPSKDWLSEEYKEIEKTPALMKLFTFIQKYNNIAKEVGYLKDDQSARNFLPYVYKSFAERVSMGGEFSFGDWLTNSLMVDENTAGYGNFNELTKQMEDTLPTYFTKEIDNPAQISENLYLNLALYIRSVLNYKYKSEIDGQIKMLYFVEQNKNSLAVTGSGKLIRVNGIPTEIGTNERNANLLLNHIRSLQYGQKYPEDSDALLGDWAKGYNKLSDKINKAVGFNMLGKVEEGKNVSLTKVLDMTNKWFSLTKMGLNVATSASVLLGGNFQAIIRSGRWYTKKDFLIAEWQQAGNRIIKNEKIHLAMMRTFMPIDEVLNREINKLSVSTVNSNSLSDALMSLMREADHSVQYANFLAFMKNTIVIDGKLYNARDYYRKSPEYTARYSLPESERRELESKFEDKVQELIKNHGIENKVSLEGNKLKIEGIDNLKNENVFKYRTLITTLGRQIAGNISPENEMLVRMSVLKRSMLVFKNWIPPLIEERFGGLKRNEALGSWEYGRARMIMKHMGPLALLKIKNVTDIIKGTDRGIELLREFYKKQQLSYQETTGKELTDLSEAEFMDMFRQALQSQLKELQILLGLISIPLAILPGLKPDDDDEKEALNRYRFLSKMLDKVTDEVSFYYDPRSMAQILNGSIFPSLGAFTDATKVITSVMTEIFAIGTGNDELAEKTHPLKNMMKALPITKEMIYYIAMFNADLAKELGIQISTQSRR